MSIKTTHYIDRATSIQIILSKVSSCKNEQIANILEEFDESHFRNYLVYDELPDDDWSYVIKNINEF